MSVDMSVDASVGSEYYCSDTVLTRAPLGEGAYMSVNMSVDTSF